MDTPGTPRTSWSDDLDREWAMYGEAYIDFPHPDGHNIDRKMLPTSLIGRWRLLRKAGYRLRGPKPGTPR